MIAKENRYISAIVDRLVGTFKKADLNTGNTKSEHKNTESDQLFVPKNTFIRGDLSSASDIIIAGEVVGNVTCRQLTIYKNALVKGDVTAEELIVYGEAFGAISAPRITFQPKCHVEGPVYCNWFKLEQGAYFEGKMHRTDCDGTTVLPLVVPQADNSHPAESRSRPHLALVS